MNGRRTMTSGDPPNYAECMRSILNRGPWVRQPHDFGIDLLPEIVEPYQIPDTNNIMPIDEKSTFNIRLDEDQIELLAKHIALQIFDYLKSDDEVKSEKPWQPKEKTPFGYG